MADRKQAQRILEALPPQELKALEELGTWHESASAAPGFKPEERAQVLAMIDEVAQPRLKKLGRDYLAAARVQQNLMWLRIHDYWHHAAQSWLRALEPKPLAEVAVAALRALGQQLKWQQLRYGPVDLAVWGNMNRAYGVAEALNAPAARAEFLKAALFSASAMDSRLPPEIDLAERLIETFAPAFVIEKAAAAELPYWTDLARPMAPARSKQPPQPGAGLRFFGPGTALARLKDLISKVERHFETPAELKLGAVDADMLLVVMRHLAAHWSPAAPRSSCRCSAGAAMRCMSTMAFMARCRMQARPASASRTVCCASTARSGPRRSGRTTAASTARSGPPTATRTRATSCSACSAPSRPADTTRSPVGGSRSRPTPPSA